MLGNESERKLAIDDARLRDVMAVDSTFLIAAVDEESREQGAPERRELLRAMVGREDTTILVPYPVLAERLLSGRDSYRSIAGLEFVPFEMRAAEILARKIGDRGALRNEKPRRRRHRLKYDAMIVATAKAWGASCILSDDDDVRSMARMVEIDCLDWPDFVATANDRVS